MSRSGRVLLRTELRLFLREPVTLFWGIAFPVVLLVVIGSLRSSRRPDADYGGLRFVDVYLPVMLAFVLAMLAINALPPLLAGYREKGILRRLSTTPVPPSRLLAAQLLIHAAVAVAAIALLVVIGRLGFDVVLPRQPLGFVVALALAIASVLAIGLLVAAVASTTKVANGIGMLLFFPMMFFAGLWLPRDAMPAGLLHVSDATPLGAAVQALQDSTRGDWPEPLHLAVMAVWAIVLGVVATRAFRWE
jgi:ABC-2 type transport system permease protein